MGLGIPPCLKRLSLNTHNIAKIKVFSPEDAKMKYPVRQGLEALNNPTSMWHGRPVAPAER
jgi:hypothetical protein